MPQPSSSKLRFMIMAAKTLSPTEDSCICNGRSYHSFCTVRLGALPGAFNILGWQFLNTYWPIIQGNFRNSPAGCHSVADIAGGSQGLVKSCRLHKLLHAGGYRPGVPHEQYSQVCEDCMAYRAWFPLGVYCRLHRRVWLPPITGFLCVEY